MSDMIQRQRWCVLNFFICIFKFSHPETIIIFQNPGIIFANFLSQEIHVYIKNFFHDLLEKFHASFIPNYSRIWKLVVLFSIPFHHHCYHYYNLSVYVYREWHNTCYCTEQFFFTKILAYFFEIFLYEFVYSQISLMLHKNNCIAITISSSDPALFLLLWFEHPN